MCIYSLLSQELKNFRALLVDDASDPEECSESLVRQIIEGDERFLFHKNSERKGAVFNKSMLLEDYALDDEEIVLGIDGDDYLIHQNALQMLDKEWNDTVWFSYGNFICNKNVPDYGNYINWSESVRKQPFPCAAPRAVRWFLLKALTKQDLTDSETGELFTLPEDWVLSLPLLELAGQEHVKFIRNRVYFYRVTKQYEMQTAREEGDRVRKQLLARAPRKIASKNSLIGASPSWNK